MPKVAIAAAGLVAGALAAFGGAVALFDWAHQGPNTRPWQAVVGWFLPAITIPAMLAALRSDGEARRGRRIFLLALALGVLLGVGGLALLARLS